MSRSKNLLADTWPLLLIGTGFSAIALAALIIAALHLINHLRAQTWVEHPAVLESIGESHSPTAGQRLNSERTTRLEGRYHYQWQGRELTGERLSFSTIHAYNLDDFDLQLAEHLGEPGSAITIRVNPADPAESVAFAGIRWAEVGACLLFVFGMGSGGLFFFYAAFAKGRPRKLTGRGATPVRVHGVTVIVMWLLAPLFGLIAWLLWRDGHPLWAAALALQWPLTLNASVAWLRQRR